MITKWFFFYYYAHHSDAILRLRRLVMEKIVTHFLMIIFLLVLSQCEDDGIVKSTDFCHKNFSQKTSYDWKKCRSSFTKSHLKKLKANVKPLSRIYENPLEHDPHINNTDWCLGPYLQFLDPPGPMTGLWSIPGSGNYWTRYLIQRASGYMTGT